jgi:hypothetical protein
MAMVGQRNLLEAIREARLKDCPTNPIMVSVRKAVYFSSPPGCNVGDLFGSFTILPSGTIVPQAGAFLLKNLKSSVCEEKGTFLITGAIPYCNYGVEYRLNVSLKLCPGVYSFYETAVCFTRDLL